MNITVRALLAILLTATAASAQFQGLGAADPSQQLKTAADPGLLRYDAGLRPAWASPSEPLITFVDRREPRTAVRHRRRRSAHHSRASRHHRRHPEL